MKKLSRTRLILASFAALLLTGVMCRAQIARTLDLEGEEVLMDMMTKPWKADVVVEVTVKDEAGNPISASASVDTFYAIGSQGGQDRESFDIDGGRRLEFKGVSLVKLTLYARGLSVKHESDVREWNFNDLDPGEFRIGSDGRTIIVRHDAVLRSFPVETRPTLERVVVRLGRDGFRRTDDVVRCEGGTAGLTIWSETLPLVTSDECTTPTLLSNYIDAPGQARLFIPGRGNVYPKDKHIVLQVCSPYEEDGVQFSGVFVKSGQFGNTTPEAPSDGYAKELILPREWFEKEKNGVVFLRLGGLYGKLIVFGSGVIVGDYDAVDPVPRPSLSATLFYNPTGSRNLRTTYPD